MRFTLEVNVNGDDLVIELRHYLRRRLLSVHGDSLMVMARDVTWAPIGAILAECLYNRVGNLTLAA
jgi:hypothetical protein